MSNDEVKSKKTDKSPWKSLGYAVLALVSLGVTIMDAKKKNGN